MPLEHWVYADQVHDSSIYKARKEDGSKGTMNYASAVPGTDGLYTDEEGLMLSLCYADCVPLFFYEPEKGWSALLMQAGKVQSLILGAKWPERGPGRKASRHNPFMPSSDHPSDLAAIPLMIMSLTE